jgi:hypothetical protein
VQHDVHGFGVEGRGFVRLQRLVGQLAAAPCCRFSVRSEGRRRPRSMAQGGARWSRRRDRRTSPQVELGSGPTPAPGIRGDDVLRSGVREAIVATYLVDRRPPARGCPNVEGRWGPDGHRRPRASARPCCPTTWASAAKPFEMVDTTRRMGTLDVHRFRAERRGLRPLQALVGRRPPGSSQNA